MVSSGYNIGHVNNVDVVRMAEIDEVHEKFDKLGVQNLDDKQLEPEKMKIKVWHVPPGERMGTHGHPTQEEFYYILEGTFRVDVGTPGDTETYELGPEGVFTASPTIARGYENIGESAGRVLAVAAPNVDEEGIPEKKMA